MKGKCTYCGAIIEIENEDITELSCPKCQKIVDVADAIHLFHQPKNEIEIYPNEIITVENEEEKIKNIHEMDLDSLRAIFRSKMEVNDLESAYLYAKQIVHLFPKSYDGKIKLFYLEHLLASYKVKKTGNASGTSFSTEVDESKAFYRYKNLFYNALEKKMESKEGKDGYIYIIEILEYEAQRIPIWLESQKGDFRHGHRCYTYGKLTQRLAQLILQYKDTDPNLFSLYINVNKTALEFYYIGKTMKGANKANASTLMKIKDEYNILLGNIQFLEPNYTGVFPSLPKYSNQHALWREKCYYAKKCITISSFMIFLAILFMIAVFVVIKKYMLLIPTGVVILFSIVAIFISLKQIKKI